jgi:dTDP-4-dehydrorhamnose 3,5-epimerase-like enzyme
MSTDEKVLAPHVEGLITRFDHRGDLTELIHCYDLPDATNENKGHGRFGQTYVVRNLMPLTIRAFHRHKILWDYFSVVHGRARVWVVQGDPLEGEAPDVWQYILDSGSIGRLNIPPGFWHGWQSLAENTIMICTGSEVYNRDSPDEERTSYDRFEAAGVFWGIRPE